MLCCVAAALIIFYSQFGVWSCSQNSAGLDELEICLEQGFLLCGQRLEMGHEHGGGHTNSARKR
jgi:hypothetical protein